MKQPLSGFPAVIIDQIQKHYTDDDEFMSIEALSCSLVVAQCFLMVALSDTPKEVLEYAIDATLKELKKNTLKSINDFEQSQKDKTK